LSSALEEVLNFHSEQAVNIPYKVVALKENVGLGKALNEGMQYCVYPWIARMDSDDIALSNRLEEQFKYLIKNSEIDIVGSWICEFDNNPEFCSKERRVPESHDAIVKFAKNRNPLNHMTVVFRKDAVMDVGGYIPMNGFEDYYLWMRMLLQGKQFANLPQVLLKARTGQGMISRRQGWKYAKDELVLEKAAYRMGFWSEIELVRNFFTRFLPRLLPVIIVEKLYNILRKF
jgi:glycosyltransferase involved in cell wall biosynthesis